MGHWALGIGHWAFGMGHWAWGIVILLLPLCPSAYKGRDFVFGHFLTISADA